MDRFQYRSRIAALSELSRPEMDMSIRKECSYLARHLPNLSEAISGPQAMSTLEAEVFIRRWRCLGGLLYSENLLLSRSSS